MYENAMLGLRAETSIHAGAGNTVAVIDLPIQREAHTGWPCIYSSGVKGALRSLAKMQALTQIDEVFGPETNNAHDHAGALAVTDARLLLLPVRSLTGHFKWVTCPAILQRLQADCARLGWPCDLPDLGELGDDTALLPEQKDNKLFLEEFRFEVKVGALDALIEQLARFMGGTTKELQEQLCVVSNDLFSHLAQYATPVNAHVRLETETKTVARGALWYEETLPPETVLYTTLSAQKSRKEGAKGSAREMLAHVLGLFESRPYLQIGGNETVGMGWCKVTTVKK